MCCGCVRPSPVLQTVQRAMRNDVRRDRSKVEGSQTAKAKRPWCKPRSTHYRSVCSQLRAKENTMAPVYAIDACLLSTLWHNACRAPELQHACFGRGSTNFARSGSRCLCSAWAMRCGWNPLVVFSPLKIRTCRYCAMSDTSPSRATLLAQARSGLASRNGRQPAKHGASAHDSASTTTTAKNGRGTCMSAEGDREAFPASSVQTFTIGEKR
jgi:hypothetical protein